jgi:hypothetical protein
MDHQTTINTITDDNAYKLISGYICNYYSKKRVVPIELILIIFKFFFYQSDAWDPLCIGPNMEIVNDDADFTATTTSTKKNKKKHTNHTLVRVKTGWFCSAYCKNIVSSGIHTWQFEIDNGVIGWWYFIGIWKVFSGKMQLKAYFNAFEKNNSYAFSLGKARCVDPNVPNKEDWKGDDQGHKYGCVCKTGDIISMCLDFQHRTLSFVINDTDYGVAFSEIEQTSYRAAIGLFYTNEAVRLLDYHHTVHV